MFEMEIIETLRQRENLEASHLSGVRLWTLDRVVTGSFINTCVSGVQRGSSCQPQNTGCEGWDHGLPVSPAASGEERQTGPAAARASVPLPWQAGYQACSGLHTV